MEKYSVTIETRDSDGNALRNENGHLRSELKLDLNIDKGTEEFHLKNLADTLIVWLPNNQIEIKLSVLNSISGTYMLMFSYYVDEKKFVKY
jgi:hypothetical protein